MKDQDFQRVIDAVAAKLNLTIVLHGEKPITKQSISLTKMPLDKALDRIMRLYGVENHAEIFNTNNNTLVSVDVHLYSTSADVHNLQPQKLIEVSDGEIPLSFDQTANLIAQSEQIEEELIQNSQPLTLEQTELLQSQGMAPEPEINSDNTPLTQEQIEKLSDRNRILELEEQIEQQPLSFEQLQQLQQNSGSIEAENETAQQPLTENQVRLLQERTND